MAGKHAGRSGSRWRTIKQQIRATETHCFWCHEPIDWSIPFWADDGQTTVNMMAGVVGHKQSKFRYPHLAEDPANLGAIHQLCNLEQGDQGHHPTPTPARPATGRPSREW